VKGSTCVRSSDCAAAICVDGHCGDFVGGCAPPLLSCGPACIDPRYDPMNCGGCGMPCDAGDACDLGTCHGAPCQNGLVFCGAGCVDVKNDVQHCGGCAGECPLGDRCVDGGCTLVCAPGQTPCFNECVMTSTDGEHCGGCGMPCGPGEVCSMGHCAAGCGPPLMSCDGGLWCADPRFDPDNCGGCGVRCPSVLNAVRLCLPTGCSYTCLPAFADCNGMMSDGCEAFLITDVNNCGACGMACPGCGGGMCP
jgi:hypothetical protein